MCLRCIQKFAAANKDSIQLALAVIALVSLAYFGYQLTLLEQQNANLTEQVEIALNQTILIQNQTNVLWQEYLKPPSVDVSLVFPYSKNLTDIYIDPDNFSFTVDERSLVYYYFNVSIVNTGYRSVVLRSITLEVQRLPNGASILIGENEFVRERADIATNPNTVFLPVGEMTYYPINTKPEFSSLALQPDDYSLLVSVYDTRGSKLGSYQETVRLHPKK